MIKHSHSRMIAAVAAAGIIGPALFSIPALAQVGNQAPVAADDSYAIIQNTATVLAVLGNDTDPDGDTLSIASMSSPAHGGLVLSSGTLTYTPVSGYLGTDSFTYTINDGHGNTDSATVNLVIAATIGVPVAVNDSATVPMNVGTSIDVLSNDTDPDGQTLTITAVTAPAHGTAVIVGGTSITYTPAAAYSGGDTFTYTVSDGFGSSATATVTVTVTSTGVAPVAQNDSINVLVNTPVIIAVLGNDTDADGDALTVTAVTTPAHGTATISGGAHTVTYTPTAAYVGGDSFGYTISDGHGHTATATVTIVVVAQGTLFANNDSATTQVDTAKTISVLANDVASNASNTLAVASVTTPAHGTATINGNGTITYTPASGYTGGDAFVYTLTETGGGTATATVTITVQAAPVGGLSGQSDKDDCKKGGWEDKGFRNQGLCVAASNHDAHAASANLDDDDDDDDDSDGGWSHGLGARIQQALHAVGKGGHGNGHDR